jgi:hypothetical protein
LGRQPDDRSQRTRDRPGSNRRIGLQSTR